MYFRQIRRYTRVLRAHRVYRQHRLVQRSGRVDRILSCAIHLSYLILQLMNMKYSKDRNEVRVLGGISSNYHGGNATMTVGIHNSGRYHDPSANVIPDARICSDLFFLANIMFESNWHRRTFLGLLPRPRIRGQAHTVVIL